MNEADKVQRAEPLEVVHFARRAYRDAFSIERVFADIRAALPGDIRVRTVVNREFSEGLLPRLRDAFRARQMQGVVNHVLGDVHYLTFFLLRRHTIVTIHDCEMVHRAHGLKRFLLWLFWIRLPVWRAGIVVAISNSVRDDIEKLLGGGCHLIEVIENPVSSNFKLAPLPADNRAVTVLHIGTKANKNLNRLIEAARGTELKLLVIGRLTDEQHSLLEASDLVYENRCDLSDAGIAAAYREATLLAFVSLSEGFGLPILEAQATGRPVLCADRDPMRSVAGDAALLVDPEDILAIRAGLQRLAFDAELRTRLIVAGQANVVRYTASIAARRYAELYYKVAAE